MSDNQEPPLVGFPPPSQGYPPPLSQGYGPPPQAYPQGYPPPPPQGYGPPPPQAYLQGYPPPPPQGYGPPPQAYYQGYPPAPQGHWPPPQGYPPQGYPPQGYPMGGYPTQYGPQIRMQNLDDNLPSASASQPCQPSHSSANSSQILFTPQVNNDLIPKIGQVFDTLDDVHRFYNNYGKEGGFGTRLHSSKKNKEGEVVRKEYVCFKEGVRATKDKPQTSQNTLRRRGLTREGCGAKLCVVKNREGAGFIVKVFVEGHNHPLTTPSRVHLLRSHREISVAKRNLSQQLSDANVSASQQMSFFEVQSGGLDKVGFLQRDLYNAERDRRKELKGHDANLMYEHFRSQQKKNPDFTFKFQDDGTGFMSHCFWADETCKKAYQHFGDVVVFDTTYQTNRYDLIFAPILGVNHHGQTTLFGCAFLNHENVSSFHWLLEEWLTAMPAGPPKMIITDQDPAMKQVVANLLPNTLHRFCIWHIVSKFSEKLGAIAYKQHYEEFSSCIWNSESPEEFESRWREIVAKANLIGNEWLGSLYQIRDQWIPAYTRHIFSAHMTSSQRAEGAHSFFKKYVSRQNSLLDFVTRFDRALAKIRHNELDLDHKDINEKPLLSTKRIMELKLSQVYTRNIFYKFQEELLQSGAYLVKSTFKDDHRCLYNVQRETESESKGREVSLDKSSNYVKCTCMKFECDGIPCRHMLAYFTKKLITEVPDQYILRRWTKAAKVRSVVGDLDGTRKEVCDTSLVVRHSRLSTLSSSVVEHVVFSEHESQAFEDYLLSTLKRFGNMNLGSGDGEGSGAKTRVCLPAEHHFKEPPKVRSKGCGKRLKGGKEKAIKKARRCTGCGLTGQSHDKRNCPKLRNMSSEDVVLTDGDDDDDDDGDDDFDSDDDW